MGWWTWPWMAEREFRGGNGRVKRPQEKVWWGRRYRDREGDSSLAPCGWKNITKQYQIYQYTLTTSHSQKNRGWK